MKPSAKELSRTDLSLVSFQNVLSKLRKLILFGYVLVQGLGD